MNRNKPFELAFRHYDTWLNDPFFSFETQAELQPLIDYPDEIMNRFTGYPDFGTGGMRGVLGAGTSRINQYTIALATQALAKQLLELHRPESMKGVVICYDTRLHGAAFAKTAAAVLVSHHIPVFLSEKYRPVPVLSYAVRKLKAEAGIMITASHNPAKYSGYKVYGHDGGQITPEFASKIVQDMQSVTDIRTLSWMKVSDTQKQSIWQVLDEQIDLDYRLYLQKNRIRPDIFKRVADLKIVYTPLHGTGGRYIQQIMEDAGLNNLFIEPSQASPDPFFSTVEVPNPESAAALKNAVNLAVSKKADLAMATDPDGDRVGIAVRDPDGQMIPLNGNQIGLLLMDYVLRNRKARNRLPEGSFCVTTRVSTRLAKRIAAYYNVELQETLTGFKFIGERIKWFDEQGDQTFCFGFEESFGYLASTEVRDKDGLQALLLICEMAAEAKLESKTLLACLDDLYQKYGYAHEDAFSVVLEGVAGKARLDGLMRKMRQISQHPVSVQLAELGIQHCEDYTIVTETEMIDNRPNKRYLPSADMLYFGLGGDLDLDWVCVRPSGTEPKLKIYCGAYSSDPVKARDKLELIRQQMNLLIHNLLEDLSEEKTLEV